MTLKKNTLALAIALTLTLALKLCLCLFFCSHAVMVKGISLSLVPDPSPDKK